MNKKHVIKAALLGAGTVGSGVYALSGMLEDEMIQKAGGSLEIKKVMVRDLTKKRDGIPQEVLTDNWEEILHDDEIQLVIEVMGGIEPAFTFAKKALTSGKSVCTSNKALVAAHGPELLALAKENNLNFMFEASVGGGIPIIRPLNQSLTADEHNVGCRWCNGSEA